MVIGIIQSYPRLSIIIISAIISLFISVINYFVLDKTKVRELKEKQKYLNEQMKLHSDNREKQMELSKEMMQHTMDSFKHSFKPMLITLVPLLLAFRFIRDIFAETAIVHSWFWYYLVAAIAASMLFRKLFKLP